MAEVEMTDLLQKVERSVTNFDDSADDVVKLELQQLQNELSLLKAFVEDARKQTGKEEWIRELERPVHKVSDEIKRILDSWATQDSNRNPIVNYSGSTRKRAVPARQVKEVREKTVKPLLDRASRIYLANTAVADGSAAENPQEKERELQPIREENVVGLEDEKDTIINDLMKPAEELSSIAIIGMAGLGKTTLARKIYNDRKIQDEFALRIWIYISQEFTKKEMLLKIMKPLTKEDMSSDNDDDLTQKVHDRLKNTKYLVVLDDVWSEQACEDIRNVLPKNETTGRVLITSRGRRAGVRVNHTLRFMTADESWELLQYELLKYEVSLDPALESIGKLTAQRCKGLPLALVVIGRILSDHYDPNDLDTTKSKWKSISHNVGPYIGSHDKLQRIRKTMKLSFDMLPPDDRYCFLYMGVFPEGYEIPKRTLINLWISEGFIEQREGRNLEDTAEVILKDLIDRNLVMVKKINDIGEVKTCCVHDAIHEFCQSQVATMKPKLFQEIKLFNDEGFYPPVSKIDRRLCIHSEVPRFMSEIFDKAPKVHSFLSFNKETQEKVHFNCGKVELPKKYTSTIPNNFNSLNVLDSMSFIFNRFPIKVTRLKDLKYVTLSCHELTCLPQEISDLRKLQTLVVQTDSPALETEANIWEMSELRHLETNVGILLLALKVEVCDNKAGKNLQTLIKLSPKKCTQDMFNRACNLKRLGFHGDIFLILNGKYSLENMIHLEKLKLEHNPVQEASENSHGLPKSNFFPPYIKKLTLSATYLDWKHMPTLAKLDTLQSLKLKDNAFTGESWEADGEGFRGLQFLLIVDTNLVTWKVSDDHFPALKCLVVRKCEKLECLPNLIRRLEKLEIEEGKRSAIKEFDRKLEIEEGKRSAGKRSAIKEFERKLEIEKVNRSAVEELLRTEAIEQQSFTTHEWKHVEEKKITKFQRKLQWKFQ